MPATIYNLGVIRGAMAKAVSRQLVPVTPRRNAIANLERLQFEFDKVVALAKAGDDLRTASKIIGIQETLHGILPHFSSG